MTEKATISQLFERFLDDQQAQRSPREYRVLATTIDLLRASLDRHGFARLDDEGRKRWETAFDNGDAGAFCHLFGAQELVQGVSFFLYDYLPDRVRAAEEVRRAASGATEQLMRWLVEGGHLAHADGRPLFELR